MTASIMRERVSVNNGVTERDGNVQMCIVSVCVSEGRLDLGGVSGAGRSGSPGSSPATTTGTLQVGMALAQKTHHIEQRVVAARSTPPWTWAVSHMPVQTHK